MQDQSHTTSEAKPLMNQSLEIIDYRHNQRVFLIGTPMVGQLNYLICGYTDETYSELLKKKMNKEKND